MPEQTINNRAGAYTGGTPVPAYAGQRVETFPCASAIGANLVVKLDTANLGQVVVATSTTEPTTIGVTKAPARATTVVTPAGTTTTYQVDVVTHGAVKVTAASSWAVGVKLASAAAGKAEDLSVDETGTAHAWGVALEAASALNDVKWAWVY